MAAEFQRRAALRDLLEEGARRHHPSGQAQPLEGSASSSELGVAVQEAAAGLGFTRVGVTEASPVMQDEGRLLSWLQAGYAGEMQYLGQATAVDQSPRAHPRALLAQARSVIVVALAYPPPDVEVQERAKSYASPQQADTSHDHSGTPASLRGLIAAYARGADYHHVLKDRLLLLADTVADLVGRPVLARACVDTAPLLERALAVRAGLGFAAKNTMLLAPGQGSYLVLGELLLDVDLAPTHNPIQLDGCGRCTACLDACPTSAFVGPYQLDARKCVSYLTIELPGEVPRSLRGGMGQRVFGCDVCQSVCPYNQTAHKKPNDAAFATKPQLQVVDLEKLLFLGSAAYRSLVRGTSLKRTHRVQLARNAAIALGNCGKAEAVEPLTRAMNHHPLPLVRSHAAWALGRLAFEFHLNEAKDALASAQNHEDEGVRHEIAAWLS